MPISIATIERRRDNLIKDFTEKLSTYDLKGTSPADGRLWSYHKTRVFAHAYYKDINTLFIMSDAETLESETNSDPYRLVIGSQTFDGEGSPTVVVFSEKERDIIMDLIDKTTEGENHLFGFKSLVVKVA